jgi:phage FluMu protein Com
MNKYKCKHCGKAITRQSSKQWIKSYCETAGKSVRITIIKTQTNDKRTKTRIHT